MWERKDLDQYEYAEMQKLKLKCTGTPQQLSLKTEIMERIRMKNFSFGLKEYQFNWLKRFFIRKKTISKNNS